MRISDAESGGKAISEPLSSASPFSVCGLYDLQASNFPDATVVTGCKLASSLQTPVP